MQEWNKCNEGVTEEMTILRGIASWDLEREDIGRTHCVRIATDCNLAVVLENQ
jgi:hypothetical protein